MQYIIIAIAAIILLVVYAKNKPHKEENRIRNEEMIEALNANIAQYTDKALEKEISLDKLPSELNLAKLSDIDKKRIALAMNGKVLSQDASYIGSNYVYRHKEQIECLKWVEKTLNDAGVPGRYRLSDSANANDIGTTLDVDILKGSHILTWVFV